jgi:LacI family transcriptional regulator
MVTMHEVARVAGVSQTTVSHVINGTRKVSPASEQAVRRAIDETGYVGDELARSMRSGRTNTIGVAMSAISNIYFAEVLAAVEGAAVAGGRLVLLVDTHDDPAVEYEAVQALLSRRVDGLVLAPSARADRSLDILRRYRTPTVLLDRFPTEAEGSFDMIGVKNEEPTASLVDLLAGHGHTRIGFVAGLPGLSTTEERIAGFLSGLERNGLPHRDDLVVYGYSDSRTARKVTSDLLQGRDRPTALVSANNAMTMGVLAGLRDLSLEVPENVSLACFDDLPWSDVLSPRLTTVSQPTTEIGSGAVELLHARIQDPGRPPQQIRMEPALKVRDSVRPLSERA